MIDGLLEMNQRLSNEVQQMRDEIAVLKGQKAKPKFKSSKMDQNTDKDNEEGASPQDGKQTSRLRQAKQNRTTADSRGTRDRPGNSCAP